MLITTENERILQKAMMLSTVADGLASGKKIPGLFVPPPVSVLRRMGLRP